MTEPQLRAFMRDRCPDSRVPLHLADGQALDVCRVVAIAPAWNRARRLRVHALPRRPQDAHAFMTISTDHHVRFLECCLRRP